MKKSFIIVLTVLIVLCSVSCDLNQIGNTMQSMNKNLFFPAKVDEVAVKETVDNAKAEVISDSFIGVVSSAGSASPSNTWSGFAAMGEVASDTVASIIELGNESLAEQKAVLEELRITPAFIPEGDRNLKGAEPSDWNQLEYAFKAAITQIPMGEIVASILDAEPEIEGNTVKNAADVADFVYLFDKTLTTAQLIEAGKDTLVDTYNQVVNGINLCKLFEECLKEEEGIVEPALVEALTEPLGEEVAARLVGDLLMVINTIEKEVIGDLNVLKTQGGETEWGYDDFTVSVNDVLVTGLFTNVYNIFNRLGKPIDDADPNSPKYELTDALGELNMTIKSFQLLLPDAADAIQDLYSSALSLIPQED